MEGSGVGVGTWSGARGRVDRGPEAKVGGEHPGEMVEGVQRHQRYRGDIRQQMQQGIVDPSRIEE